jgi:hypothetical protein
MAKQALTGVARCVRDALLRQFGKSVPLTENIVDWFPIQGNASPLFRAFSCIKKGGCLHGMTYNFLQNYNDDVKPVNKFQDIVRCVNKWDSRKS